jgi:hypothetical protein
MTAVPRFAGAIALLLASAAPAAAQRWRAMEVSRQLRDTAEYQVRVEYGAGRFDLRPTSEPVLYAMQLRYDEDRGRPVHQLDADQRSLTLGITNGSVRLSRSMGRDSEGEMRLGLSRLVPMQLTVDLGATRARLDLGGLSLRELRLETGASDTKVDFSEPNASTMKSLSVQVGAAGLELTNLGNANASNLSVNGGVGSVTLDFGGRWTQDMTVDADLALGKLHLRVPRDVGIRLEVQRVLASLDHDGLEKRGNAYVSDNWERAPFRLRVRAQTVFGGIEIERVAP